MSETIARRTLRGSLVSMAASMVTLVLGFVRAVLLARWLLPEHFGLVALALFYIGLAAQLRGLGLDAAIIHRQDADESLLRTYFSLRLGTDGAAALLLLLVTPLLARAYPRMVGLDRIMPLCIVAYLLANLSQVQETLLRKQLAFSSLALVDVLASLTMTLIAPYLAWRGWGVGALVAERLSGLGARFLLTWGPLRRWRPRLGWDRAWAQWLWEFGKPSWVASNLNYFLDRFDDFWIGTVLGQTPLGYYDKAYELAHYPRRVLANPLIGVLGPVFARLQEDRLRLSRVFYRSAHVILRTSLALAGAMALAMPEFIHLVIGDKWLPMLLTFRLMMVYIVLDALVMLVSNLLLAVGQPRALQQANLVQAAFFLPAVILGAHFGGIQGVALAADGMLLLGAWRLYRPLRRVVDFSLLRLMAWPLVALGLAWGAAVWWEAHPVGEWWGLLLLKLGIFGALFGGMLLLAERGDYAEGVRWLWRLVRNEG
jgi:O-antigen/teichoic acid export membrane protein